MQVRWCDWRSTTCTASDRSDAVRRRCAPGTAEILLGEEEAARVLIDAPAFGLGLIAAVPDRLRIAERTLSARSSVLTARRQRSRESPTLSRDTSGFREARCTI